MRRDPKLSDIETTKRGARLGKYSLVAEIARGGMGIVYLAQSVGRHGFKKLVVVKQLKPELADDARFRQMFLDEARLAARLNHRNIVQTVEVDEEDNRFFFVMEYLEGRTFHHVARLKGDRALPVPSLLRVLCDVLDGLHYAHELTDYDGTPLGVVHRDVSPRNIFLTYDGQVKLLDFGVAKAEGRDQETEAGQLKGRVPYMAPEHVSEKKVDRRADVFSTGVLVREVLTGKRLWEGHNEIEILRQLLQKTVPPLPADANISEDARAIITKAMAPDRADRYQTAHEMRCDLEQYVARLDPAGSLAKVGEHVSREFSSQRAQVKALIEDHVAAAESMPPTKSGEALPTLPISAGELQAAGSDLSNPSSPSVQSKPSSPLVQSKPSNPSAQSNPSGPSAQSKPTGPSSPWSGSLPTDAAHVRSSSPVVVSAAAPSAGHVDPSKPVFAPSPVLKDISIPPPPPKSNAATYVFLSLGFIAVVVGLTAAILSTREPSNTKLDFDSTSATGLPTERPGTVAMESDAAATDDPPVEVTVRATPLSAQIWIDEVSVGEGPHTAKYKRGSRHYIRVSAPGYVTKTETVDVDATASMMIILEKEAGAATTAVRPHAPRAAPAPMAPAAKPER
jgi:serine/threonine-protein kinase